MSYANNIYRLKTFISKLNLDKPTAGKDKKIIAYRDGYTSSLFSTMFKTNSHNEEQLLTWIDSELKKTEDDIHRASYSMFDHEYVTNYARGYIGGMRDIRKIFSQGSSIYVEIDLVSSPQYIGT